MGSSSSILSPVRRLGFSLACQAWGRSSGPSSWSVWVRSLPSRVLIGSLPLCRSCPAARDSGKRIGNNRRMRGGNKVLKRVFYQSALARLRSAPESRVFYDRMRAEGKWHTQALNALARRRVNVLWAMLHDGTTFETRSAA
jgi:transposase